MRTFLVAKGQYGNIVALDHPLKLLYHSLTVRLCVSLIVVEYVDIVGVTAPIHFHCLQEADELTEARLSVHSDDI